MGEADSTQFLVRLLIAILSGAAFLLIVLILGGSSVDETSGKAIGTAIAVAAFSLTGVAGTTLAKRRPDLSLLGYLTAIVSLAAFIAVLSGIWSDELFGPSDWRVAGDMIVLAIAGGHASLLLGSQRANDSEAVRLVRTGVIVALAVLCLLAIVEISSPGRDVGVQPMAVVAVLYVLGTGLVPLLRRSSSPQPAMASQTVHTDGVGSVLKLDHLAIGVSDIDRAAAFYRDVLGAEVIATPEGRVAFRIGGQQLNVHGPGTEAAPLPAEPVRPGNSDLCFLWDGSLDAAVEHLHGHAVQIVEGPVVRIGAYGPGQSVYFRDPDGSLIELISYA